MAPFDWKEESERVWNQKSDYWSSNSKEMWDAGSRKDIVPFFMKHLPTGSHICDLGCGDGYGSLKLVQGGYRVTGVDVSEEMIEKAKIVTEGMDISFIKGDIAHLPFEDEAYDGTMAINSLEWTESPLAVITEMKRMVKTGGVACIGILGPTAKPRENSYQRLYGEKVVCNTIMPWEFERLATENGWEKIDELGVFKRGADQLPKGSLSGELQQALSFMWVFVLRKSN
ncbi:class I SAM-dependent methyltransferase [Cytobacillus spongiae]|jgi:ubiquinone/menaquinone biosynthesis C-methylase UbiE|uniref:class I SAM-dependent methyltransferase n=1 Tax=Cytobacillus spongiae TaxID=2901381 RepID=UPI001F3078DC|nr:class I SAM-dependent methyltransferase [Cytobacillus spongiae]UII54547.1 class I SAM-dependent methyltransferase [Cytobacillus spongiae]